MEIRRVELGGKVYEARLSERFEELPDAAEIRRSVFCEEQGFVNEFDDTDSRALHCVIYLDVVPAAVGRLFAGDKAGEAHVGRVAVSAEFRGRGVGSVVMSALEQAARERGFSRVVLSAQCRAQGFYLANGYAPRGDVYSDEGCPHIEMTKEL